ANGINIAFSNVCFELWLLQHFDYRNRPYTCCDDLLRNSPLKADLLKVGVKNYAKGDPHLFTKIQGGVTNARARAEALNRESLLTAANGATQPHMLSVYTDIHLLLNAIDAFQP
ncbi:TPA: RloB domain-containing protein, partial [Enterobacter chengduensis]|nr:RloB domain-containing protein [Enterobacter chengduensis]